MECKCNRSCMIDGRVTRLYICRTQCYTMTITMIYGIPIYTMKYHKHTRSYIHKHNTTTSSTLCKQSKQCIYKRKHQSKRSMSTTYHAVSLYTTGNQPYTRRWSKKY